MKRTILITAFMINVASVSLAHEGPRIWIGNVDDKLTTFRSDDDLAPSDYTPCRLFRGEMESFFNVFTTEFPGYEVLQSGGNIPSGTTFRFDITGPALYFDEINGAFASTTDIFGPPEPGPIPELALSLEAMLRVTGDQPVSGFDFFTFFAIGDHSHLSYTLLGDGETASDGPSGVYAVSMMLSCDALETSDTYYLLLGKDVAISDPMFDAAFDVAKETLIGLGKPGDMDCSGEIDGNDVSDFITAVLTSDSSDEPAGCCNVLTADMNQDQEVDGLDISSFVDELFSQP
ncbi:MAG: hypothetical protein MI923_13990 [Phycisphaerales bacterium]|nr:hypothetical protein [Phycisphaerales bacterium]